MFASRFGRRPLLGVNRNMTYDESEQSIRTNRTFGNSRSRQQTYEQEKNQEQQDSINSSQSQPATLTRKSQENTRLSRYGYNRRSAGNLSTSWKRQQPLVRQADTAQSVYTKGSSKNANKQLKLQPAVVGTAALQLAPESQSPRNPAVNYQRRLSDVSEQPSELSSSFCYVNQGNLAKTSGNDDFKQTEIPAFSPEPDKTMTDYCAYCLSRQKFQAATHHCDHCGPFGRYMCQRCLGPHNDFTEDHNIKSLSGQTYRKQKSVEPEDLEIWNKGTHPNFIKDVSVNTEEDDQSCQITGFCQLENGTIVLTEMNNKAIKTLDSQTYRVTNTIQLQNYPMDICCINDMEALVILYKSTIQYVRIDGENQIQLTRKKVLKHECLCLAFCNGKIFIGSSKSLYIYDEKWTELDNITNELFGDERIFSDQFSIAVSMHEDVTTIYVADENTGMYAIELTGHDLTTTWKFKDCNTFKASGLCFDGSQNVLLSDRGSDRLIKMNAEGMILSILLDSRSGIQPLKLPFYNKKNNHLIVSLSGKDIIKVFDFK